MYKLIPTGLFPNQLRNSITLSFQCTFTCYKCNLPAINWCNIVAGVFFLDLWHSFSNCFVRKLSNMICSSFCNALSLSHFRNANDSVLPRSPAVALTLNAGALSLLSLRLLSLALGRVAMAAEIAWLAVSRRAQVQVRVWVTEKEKERGENVNVCGGIDFNGYSDTFAADVGQSNFSNNL